jgi:hypothetical protein
MQNFDPTAKNRAALSELISNMGGRKIKQAFKQTPLGQSFASPEDSMRFDPVGTPQDFSNRKVPQGDPNAWLGMFDHAMSVQPQDQAPQEKFDVQSLWNPPFGPAMMTEPPVDSGAKFNVDELWGGAFNQPAMMTPPPQDAPNIAQAGPAPMGGGAVNPLDRYMKQIEAKSVEGINAQKKSAESLKRYKEALMNSYESQMDLSPLMKLADQWSGSNMSAGYKRPESGMERLEKIMAAEQGYGNAQGRITDDEIALLRNQANAELMKQKLNQKAGGGNPLNDLSGDAKKMVGLANEGINAVMGMEQALTNDIGPSRLDPNTPLIGTFASDNAFTSNQRIAAEMFGRLQSGGAINSEEEKRFIAMGPRPGDSKEIAQQKLAAQKAALEDRMRIYGVTPEALGSIGLERRPSVPTVSDPTQSTNARAMPQVGEVRRGYRYKGGSPRDKASWEKI